MGRLGSDHEVAPNEVSKHPEFKHPLSLGRSVGPQERRTQLGLLLIVLNQRIRRSYSPADRRLGRIRSDIGGRVLKPGMDTVKRLGDGSDTGTKRALDT